MGVPVVFEWFIMVHPWLTIPSPSHMLGTLKPFEVLKEPCPTNRFHQWLLSSFCRRTSAGRTAEDIARAADRNGSHQEADAARGIVNCR